MLKRAIFFIVILSALFLNASVTALESSPCPVPVPADQDIECGYIDVPEDRAEINGRTIQIAYAVVHSHSPSPEPDPVILLNGGPGGPMRFTLQNIAAYNFILASRDIILFDPRGVDNSRPNLDCHELAVPFRRSALGENVPINSWLAVSKVCQQRWADDGIDISRYNSINTALDSRDLWRRLGYKKVNLLSLSYGTVLAQILMREVPDELRAVVLDSALPLDTRVEENVPEQAVSALNALFESCTQDFICRVAYPDLREVYERLRDETLQAPLELEALDPATNQPFGFAFNSTDLSALISSNPRVFPAAIYDLSDGNYDSAIEQRENLLRNLDRFGWGHAFGLVNTVFCTEEMFLVPAGERASSLLPEARMMADQVQEAYCQNWVQFPMQPLLPLAIADTPTLILVGEYDTRLPASYAQRIAKTLPNAQWVLFKGAGHVVYQSSPCGMAMIAGFIVDPQHPINSSCAEDDASASFGTKFLLRSAFIQPFANALIVLFSFIAGTAILYSAVQLSKRRYNIAWRMAFRRVGWLAPVLTIVLLIIIELVNRARLQNIQADSAQLFVYVISLATGIQAALLFAPDDEPAFEIQLAAPRPLAWTMLERFAVLLSQQLAIGLLISFLLSIQVLHWIAPVMFFAAIGSIVAVLTRRSNIGVLFVILIWFASFVAGDVLIERMPILWIAHPFLDESSRYYMSNRWLILLFGFILMIGLAAAPSRAENLLFGGIKSRRGGTRPTPPMVVPGVEASDLTPASDFQIRFAQLTAMIRTELTLQWRRRSLGASAFALIILPALGAVVSMGSYQSYKTIIAMGGLAAESAKAEITFLMMPYFILAGLLVYALLIPIITADIIPSDSQIRIREILDSLPMPRMIYLLGKVFAVWGGILIMSFAQLILCSFLWQVLVAPFQIDLIVESWAILLWMGLVNSATVMLLSARLSSRRSVMVGVVYAFISVISIGAGILLQGHFIKAILPGRPAIMLYYIFVLFVGRLPNTNIAPEILAQYASHVDIAYAAIAGLGQMIIVGLLAWLLHRKED